MAETGRLRFGIIGCGGAALAVAQALAAAERTALAATYDLNPALARDLAEHHGGTAFESLDALLGSPEVDAVYIAVPHYQLAPLAAQALQAGKHALVEKPMALSLAEADALIALADAKGLGLGVNYDLRQAAQAVQARALVQGGAIGTVIGVRCNTLIDKPTSYWQVGYSARYVSPWRATKAQAGGGVVLMNSSHQLDAVRFITGLEVARVSGVVGARVVDVEVEDTGSASLLYNNGAIGSLFAGAHLAGVEGGSERLELFGREGQLRMPSLYGDDPVQLFLRRDWTLPNAAEPLAAGRWHSLPHEPAHIYQGTVEAFARAIQAGQPPSPNGRDARAVLAIVLALYRASDEGSVQVLEQPEVKHA
jgi:predicted dehydrogenase